MEQEKDFAETKPEECLFSEEARRIGEKKVLVPSKKNRKKERGLPKSI